MKCKCLHVRQKGDYLKRLLESSHATQMKVLDSRFEKENKEMKGKQAKISVETAKEVSMDKTLRNKAERERRLREKNSNNTKKVHRGTEGSCNSSKQGTGTAEETTREAIQ